MSPLTTALLFATLAGAAIPLGALLARWESFLSGWLETELRHTIIAFGGGVLMAAVALVLVPDGLDYLGGVNALVAFAAGGGAFFVVDWLLSRDGGSRAQLLAMLLDYVPEAVALGAAFALKPETAPLLALLIALQNVPEAFNAARELGMTRGVGNGRRWLGLWALVPIAPAAAWLGHVVLADLPALLGGIMLFAAGGILYLMFEDIAPQAKLENHWAPALGAVAGFLLGLAGDMWIGG